MIELLRSLGALTEPPATDRPDLAALLELGESPSPTDHAELFLFQLPPFASIYLGPEGKLGGEARNRIAGFWRAVGQTPPAEPDHLAALLGLYCALADARGSETEGARRALLEQSATALLHEHLLSWTGPYLERVKHVSSGAYGRWAALLQDALAHEMRTRPPFDGLSAQLRAAPPLPDPRSRGGPALLDGLLAPAVSGVILSRADLARAASECRLGLRAGERRYALEALIAQEGGRVLAWLAREAEAAAARHEQLEPHVGASVAAFWSERARATAELLTALSPMPGEAPCPR